MLPLDHAIGGEAGAELEHFTACEAAAVLADVVVERQAHGLVGDEGVVAFAEVAGEGQVRLGLHEGDVGRHRCVTRAALFGDDRGEGGIFFGFGIGATFGAAFPV